MKKYMCASLACALLVMGASCLWAEVVINASNFPDDAFRGIVSGFDRDKDGVLSNAEIARVGSIGTSRVYSLKGIEYFTNLTRLSCSNNYLTELDVSRNTALTSLNCSGNHLTRLDLTSNTALTTLDCRNNQITSLNLRNNTKLSSLNCANNYLTELDLSNNTLLLDIDCRGNQITTINLKNLDSLKNIKCQGNLLRRLDVSGCISLTEIHCQGNQLESLNVTNNTGLTRLECSNNQLYTLDLSNNQKMKELRCSNNHFAALDLGSISYSSLSCGNQNIAGLKVTRTNDTAYPYRVDFRDYMTASQTANIKADTVEGRRANNSKFTAVYSDGVAQFAEIPAKVTYSYITAPSSSARLMGVTISRISDDQVNITITKLSLSDAAAGTAYNDILTADTSGVTWEISGGNLPEGLTLNPNTGTITGTPSTPGEYTFEITASKGIDSASKEFTLTVKPQSIAITITSGSEIRGRKGEYLSYNLTANVAGVRWSVAGLPDGVNYDPDTGLISGRSTVAGTFYLSVIAQLNGASDSKAITMIIEGDTPSVNIHITKSSLANGTVGRTYSDTLTSDAQGTMWEVTSGALPEGLSLNPNTGAITGTPSRAGDYPFTVRASGNGTSTSQSFTIVIAPSDEPGKQDPITPPIDDPNNPDPVTPPAVISILNSSLPNASEGSLYRTELYSDTSGVTWSVSDGSLPDGLTLNPSTGTISGVPESAGVYIFTVTISSGSSSRSKDFTLQVTGSDTPGITTMFLSDGTVGTPYEQQLRANLSGPVVWRVTNGALLGGLVLSQSGLLSGTPTTAGTATIEVTVTDGTNRYTSWFTLTVNPAGSLTITSSSEIRAKRNQEVIYTFTANIPGVKWTADAALPSGLTLNPDSGALRGISSVTGTFPFTVSAVGNGQSASRYMNLIIEEEEQQPEQHDEGSGGGGGCNIGFSLIAMLSAMALRKSRR